MNEENPYRPPAAELVEEKSPPLLMSRAVFREKAQACTRIDILMLVAILVGWVVTFLIMMLINDFVSSQQFFQGKPAKVNGYLFLAQTLLFIAIFIGAVVIYRYLLRKMGVACPYCRCVWRNPWRDSVLATGHCTKCGNEVLQ